ncbi:hypothetical protein [Umezawaea tangerina]|uniref:Uncharacterized protein n=1 Tax=Umezawaea tangerina TaxID=84725 RepID=A0A2T0SVI8_9PSEU|nr:hypothetical protein [Umezawaea tangerina]PRY37431.1 hypothetical protein CLV43_110242 [Umezawaea tangerina]
MRELSAEELGRLVGSNRRLKIAMVVTVGLVVAAVVLLVVNDVDFVIRGGAGLGALIGLLLLIPNRKVVRELGLTPAEARAVLLAERERRSGVAALPPAERARRDELRGRIWLVVGVVLMVLLLVSAFYFFGKAGQTVEEDAPLDPWFGASFFVGFASLVLGAGALAGASNYRKSAAAWRLRAGTEA